MKMEQERLVYKPIVITLENDKEIKTFISILNIAGVYTYKDLPVKTEDKQLEVILETEEEAKMFIDIIDNIDYKKLPKKSNERKLIIDLSDAFTDGYGQVPNFNNME